MYTQNQNPKTKRVEKETKARNYCWQKVLLMCAFELNKNDCSNGVFNSNYLVASQTIPFSMVYVHGVRGVVRA